MPTEVRSYRFEAFTLNPAERQLLKGGAEVILRPKAFDTLVCLVRDHGHAVSRDSLLDAVWPETNVSEAVLTHCIAEVRQALSDDVRRPRFVKTMSRHGYKFIAPVQVSGTLEGAQVSGPPAPPGTPAAAPPAFSIVVLPFANMSPDPGNEFFCDGLSEELINGLTKVGGLQVVAHSSSFSLKGRDVDAREIGRQLNVGSILEGSVRQTGDRLRVSAQLIDAACGMHMWSEQYDCRLEDIFSVQDRISQAILSSLKVEFLGDARSPLIRPSTANMDAYVLGLAGAHILAQALRWLHSEGHGLLRRGHRQGPGFRAALHRAGRFALDAGRLGLQRRTRSLPQGGDVGRHGAEARSFTRGGVRVARSRSAVLGLGLGRSEKRARPRAGPQSGSRTDPSGGTATT